MSVFLGLDLGTSAVKGILVDEAEAILAEAEVPLATSRPRPGWSEQDGEDWWRAVEAVFAGLRGSAPSAWGSVRAIGLSGQMHGAVCLDGRGRLLRPAILWNDGRSLAECRTLSERLPDLETIAGVIAMPGFTAPKLLWMKHHEPDVFARIATVLAPKDYVRLHLTGERATDMSDAAGTLWLDESRRDWSDPVLAACGLDRRQVPHLVEGSEASARLRPDIADGFGLPRGAIVAGGAGDAAAGAVGIGAVGEGDAFLSLGTSGQIFVAAERYEPHCGLTLHHFAHALPGRWFRMAAMLNGATCLKWLAGVLGELDPGALIRRAEAVRRGPGGPLFLPYLSGERTPHNDPDARGAFAGLDAGTCDADLVAAVLEGVAFAFADGLEALRRAEVKPERLTAIGGGSRSPFWMRMFADVLGCTVEVAAESAKGPAFGATRLARLAVTREPVADVCRRPAITAAYEPDAGRAEAYTGRLARFRALYAALRPSAGQTSR